MYIFENDQYCFTPDPVHTLNIHGVIGALQTFEVEGTLNPMISLAVAANLAMQEVLTRGVAMETIHHGGYISSLRLWSGRWGLELSDVYKLQVMGDQYGYGYQYSNLTLMEQSPTGLQVRANIVMGDVTYAPWNYIPDGIMGTCTSVRSGPVSVNYISTDLDSDAIIRSVGQELQMALLEMSESTVYSAGYLGNSQ